MRRLTLAQIRWLLLAGVVGCSVEGSRQAGDDCLADRECVSPLRCVLGPAGVSRCAAPVSLDVPRVDVTAVVDAPDATAADAVDAASPPADVVDAATPPPDVVDVVTPPPDAPRADVVDVVDVVDVARADIVDVRDAGEATDAADDVE